LTEKQQQVPRRMLAASSLGMTNKKTRDRPIKPIGPYNSKGWRDSQSRDGRSKQRPYENDLARCATGRQNRQIQNQKQTVPQGLKSARRTTPGGT
ncbi:MAG: hypothetical protein WBD21_16800, partial [Candidatus Acidiferrales bacterium]